MASTAQPMGNRGPLQIKNQFPDGTFARRRHVLGNWYNSLITVTTTNTVTVSVGVPVTYVKRGFYTVLAQYEYWTSTNRDAAAPSGHSLVDITVIGEVVG